jgi:arsenate reductase
MLFVCVHNAGRSQMAAGLLDRTAEGRVKVDLPAPAPAEEIHPNVREAMAEGGINPSREFPKPLTDDAVKAPGEASALPAPQRARADPGERSVAPTGFEPVLPP